MTAPSLREPSPVEEAKLAEEAKAEDERFEQEYQSIADEWDQGLNANQRAYLTAYAMSGNHSASSRTASVPPGVHYKWMREEVYQAEFARAEIMAGDILEAEARRRGLKQSDTLLIFLLKAHKPEKYGDKVQLVRKLEDCTDEQLDEIIAKGRALAEPGDSEAGKGDSSPA